MNEGYSIRYLADLMGWEQDQANKEMNWLQGISAFKYDSYRDYWAISRFTESLLEWLQQFEAEDRKFAYGFIRDELIFISASEFQCLVGRTLPVYVRRELIKRVSQQCSCPQYLVWANEKSAKRYEDILSRTLFVGLSDGARIDSFRRANVGLIDNEQVVLGYEVSDGKWADLAENLIERTGDPDARFEALFLIDDFTASGKTLIRKKGEDWKGKLVKIARQVNEKKTMFTEDFIVVAHHYIGTERAQINIQNCLDEAEDNLEFWFPTPVHTTRGKLSQIGCV